MAARSLRAHLLRMLLPPIAALLAVGALVGYYPSIEPANEAYDQALIDIGVSPSARYVRTSDAELSARFAAGSGHRHCARDRYDTMFYRVLGAERRRTSRATTSCPIAVRAQHGAYDARLQGRGGARRSPLPAPCGSLSLHGARRRDHGQAHAARARVPVLDACCPRS